MAEHITDAADCLPWVIQQMNLRHRASLAWVSGACEGDDEASDPPFTTKASENCDRKAAACE
jgi:hypothetical protein